MTTETTERRWRLQAWDKTKQLIYDGLCESDADLDAQLRGIEARPDLARYAATPAARAGTQPTVHVPRTEPAPTPPEGAPEGWPCEVCRMPKPECERRAHVSGHTYQPTA